MTAAYRAHLPYRQSLVLAKQSVYACSMKQLLNNWASRCTPLPPLFTPTLIYGPSSFTYDPFTRHPLPIASHSTPVFHLSSFRAPSRLDAAFYHVFATSRFRPCPHLSVAFWITRALQRFRPFCSSPPALLAAVAELAGTQRFRSLRGVSKCRAHHASHFSV